MHNIKWYFSRLSTMSGLEIPYRIFQKIQTIYEKSFKKKWSGNKKIAFPGINILEFDATRFANYTPVTKIFDHEISVDERINWHKDISNNKEFPLSFSKDIDIRSGSYGSAKHVWEVNRLQFLPGICMNYKKTGDHNFLDLFQKIIKSWKDQNPYLIGVNWYSNIEINIRLINWFFCWEILNVPQLIKDSESVKKFINEDWLPLIYLHIHYSFRNPSKYSSANNHVISEYAGLFIATSLWSFSGSRNLNRKAKKGLEKEIVKQHSKGVNKEEAAEYIQFITDFFLISYIIGDKTSNSFSNQYRSSLHDICQYIYEFTDIAASFPKYGDEDDGRVIILEEDQETFNNFQSILTSASILFKSPEYKSKSNGFDLKNHLLFGKEGENIFNELPVIVAEQKTTFYKDQGHFIFRKQLTQNKEIYCHFDAAPLGYLSIAAHGHADALSFLMNIDGREFFVDPGTYSYHTHEEWRKFFISTLAHNTLRINRKDQAKSVGPTLWTNHYEVYIVKAESCDEYDVVVASHTGYKNMGVVHIREIRFDKVGEEFIIKDLLNVNKPSEYIIEFPLHLHPEVVITNDSLDFIELELIDRQIRVITDPKFDSEIIHGQRDPILGWYSKSFYVKEPTNVIYQTASISESTSFITTIKIIN